ncbi:MAG: hypothetical protein ABIM74_09470, partial [candidate division WOR-3 bacterium]
LLWYLGLSVENTAKVMRAMTGRNVSPSGVYKRLLMLGFDLEERLRGRKKNWPVVHIAVSPQGGHLLDTRRTSCSGFQIQ